MKKYRDLCHSSIWFADGTFKTAPNIFAQMFTIIGLRERTGHYEEVVVVPLVHAFSSGKKTEHYEVVLEVVKDAVEWFYIASCVPTKSDFELAVNACTKVFPGVLLSGCYFHLGQIICRRRPGNGLQEQYRNPLYRTVKRYMHIDTLRRKPRNSVLENFSGEAKNCV